MEGHFSDGHCYIMVCHKIEHDGQDIGCDIDKLQNSNILFALTCCLRNDFVR